MNVLPYTAGKAAISDNPGRFNKEASASFHNLTAKERNLLQQQIDDTANHWLTRKEALNRGSKLFERIQHSVSNDYISITVEPLYYGHPWYHMKCPDLRGVLISG